MKGKISFDSAVYFVRLSVYIAWTWPLSIIATKWQIIKYNVAWVFSFLNVLCFVLSQIGAILVHSSNSVAVTQSTCFICGGMNYFVKTILYRVRRRRIEIIMDGMVDFCKNAKSHEKNVLQSYMDDCWLFYAIIIVMNYLTAISLTFGPLIMPHLIKNFTVYPFSYDSGYVKFLIYIHQIIAVSQFSAAISTDSHIAMIMWYATARLEILADEIKNLKTARELRHLAKKHDRLLSYADEVSDTISWSAFCTTAVCGVATIMACMQLVSDQPLAVKVQFGPLIMIATANLFVSAWPAENLLRVCDLVANAAYNTSWIDMSIKMRKSILIILRRSQKPVTVSIGGFIPTLSLRYYAAFLSAAFSYFTTLRVALMVDHEN